ncbi:MAG: hypothetical protein K9G33_13000, partial [Sneathiella sp.]|nr:hypothetical protein [Sneathiella sp.]
MMTSRIEKPFLCQGLYSSPLQSVVVLSKKQSPTVDQYLTERLKSARIPVYYWHLGHPPPCAMEGAFVIVVRYINKAASTVLLREKDKLSGVAYLLDDDIRDASKDPSLPKHYRLLMGHFWRRWSGQLQRLASELWVCSDHLRIIYGAEHRIDPFPSPFPLPRERSIRRQPHSVRICYHATKTHREDLRWLLPIVTEVQAQCPFSEFEIIGDRKSIKQFRHIPRLQAFAPFEWNDYQKHASSSLFDIGLSPLTETVFNQSRSWVKYLDNARLGAVGIYSAKASVYQAVVRHGENGLLVK